MTTTWTIDSSQSDVLIKKRRSIIAYLSGTKDNFNGHVDIKDNKLEDVALAFSLEINKNHSKLKDIDNHLRLSDYFANEAHPMITFKSTYFEKINNNINFLKGNLTIKNVTKVVELDTKLVGYNTYNGVKKAFFEIKGQIDPKDFGLATQFHNNPETVATAQKIHLIANLEFII
ncbi:YceI family protein [Flavobacterium sp. K5-23]|uniref:YceI family protein n=1 Tax=Flavobacterium sp. K5-23 TaxID=2746225 RepID=UPI00200E4DBF|nr:YceI family protein [Flavobacterium sp. K5-23]UQD55769.1 YceI family protein [Flavobacterium sp. K5-23]